MKRGALVFIPILLVLWSCSDGALFLGEVEEPAQLTVETVDAGAVLAVGDPIPLHIARDPVYTGDETTTDRLLVELLDHEGTVLAEQRYDSVDDAETLPDIDLPDLEEGLYQLRTSYYDGEELVTERTVPFFLTSQTYRIVGLSSYPASSYPEADALLRISLDVPPDSDPFLVWRVNGRVVESGYLSATGTTVAVLAPAAPGIFPVEVDLYPVFPENSDYSEIPAPSTYSTELYVSDSPSPARSDLAPEENYFALYHFRGSLRDDGARGEWFKSRDFSAEPFGLPELSAREGTFGYYLDGSSGFRSEGAVWPVYADELSPVSISFRVLPETLPEPGRTDPAHARLMTISLPSAELLSVITDDRGTVGVELPVLEQTIWSEFPVLRSGEPETVTISVVPNSEASVVRFFAGGLLVSSHEFPGLSLESLGTPRLVRGADRWALLADGVTTLGAEEDGFVGVIDEFGVFFRDDRNEPATNTALFLESMRSAYGERLLYAASFEDPTDAETVEVLGEATVSDGAVSVPAGSSVAFPPFGFEEEDLVVTMELAGSGLALLRFFGIESEELLTEHDIGMDPDDQRVEVTITHSDGTLVLMRDETEETIATGLDEFSGLWLELAARGDAQEEAALTVLSIVARRERPQIPERLFDVQGE